MSIRQTKTLANGDGEPSRSPPEKDPSADGQSRIATSGSERNSPRERIVHAILDGLYSGTYRPGDRLVESRLTEEYRVSRGPVREAFNRLSAMGIVSLTLQRGAQIRELSIRDAISTLVVVQTLVGLAAQLAAEESDPAVDGPYLQKALDRLDSAGYRRGTAASAVARDDFYAALVHVAGNRELGRALNGLQTHLVRVQFGYITETGAEKRREDYRAIVAAICQREPAKARLLARTYIGRALKRLRNSRQAL